MKWEASQDLTDEFFDKLVGVAEFLGCSPVDMARVMMNESGIKPTAWNKGGNASGLIQFMPATLSGLGWALGHDSFRTLTAVEQLGWVKRYYEPKMRYGLENAARLYLATFLPALMANQASHEMGYVLCNNTDIRKWAYDANKGFDRDHKGHIDMQDLQDAMDRACKGSRWTEVAIRIAQARQILEDADTEPSLPNLVIEVPVTEHLTGLFDAEQEPGDKA